MVNAMIGIFKINNGNHIIEETIKNKNTKAVIIVTATNYK